MSYADAFDARLNRLRQGNGTEPARPADGGTRPVRRLGAAPAQPPSAPPPTERGLDVELLTLATLGLFFVPLGIFAAWDTVDVRMPKIDLAAIELPAMERFAAPDPGAGYPERSLWERAIFGLGPRDTWALLPPAPDGWLRVTQADARLPDPLGTLAVDWPGGPDALRLHPGYEPLNAHNSPTVEESVYRADIGTAFYLHPDGSTLQLTLDLYTMGSERRIIDPLGAILALAEEERGAAQTVEPLSLGDHSGFRLTEDREGPTGITAFLGRVTGITSAPVAPQEVFLAIGSHGRMEIRGTGRLGDVQALVAGTDMAAIAERMALLGPAPADG